MKISKKNSDKYVKEINSFISNDLSGELVNDNDHNISYKIETIVGELLLTINKEQSIIYTVFGRFKDIDKAKEKFDSNPFTGKYNFLSSDNIDEAIEATKQHLETTI
jgi:nucleoid DNA-binding protein